MKQSFIQITHKLRFSRGPGQGDFMSERPRDPRTRAYLDQTAPTVIELDPTWAAVDISELLRLGAIIPYSPPRRERVIREETADGQTG